MSRSLIVTRLAAGLCALAALAACQLTGPGKSDRLTVHVEGMTRVLGIT